MDGCNCGVFIIVFKVHLSKNASYEENVFIFFFTDSFLFNRCVRIIEKSISSDVILVLKQRETLTLCICMYLVSGICLYLNKNTLHITIT